MKSLFSVANSCIQTTYVIIKQIIKNCIPHIRINYILSLISTDLNLKIQWKLMINKRVIHSYNSLVTFGPPYNPLSHLLNSIYKYHFQSS